MIFDLFLLLSISIVVLASFYNVKSIRSFSDYLSDLDISIKKGDVK